jgi:hypothetical protein
MATLTEHIIKLTDHRDRELLDLTLAKGLIDLLRMDRLVLRRGSDGTLGQWWVLDYKSTGQPHLQPLLRDQLLGYRAAVEQAHPGHRVRAAFLTALGTLIEIDAP